MMNGLKKERKAFVLCRVIFSMGYAILSAGDDQ